MAKYNYRIVKSWWENGKYCERTLAHVGANKEATLRIIASMFNRDFSTRNLVQGAFGWYNKEDANLFYNGTECINPRYSYWADNRRLIGYATSSYSIHYSIN